MEPRLKFSPVVACGILSLMPISVHWIMRFISDRVVLMFDNRPARKNTSFLATIATNGSPYATGPLSCLSVTLVYCDQTVRWIKMPLGTEVRLGAAHVLDGDPAPPRKGAQQA